MTTTDNFIKHYQLNAKINEPIEIRLIDSLNNRYSYLGTYCEDGTINHKLMGVTGMGQGLGTLGASPVTYPRKAVIGWQAEVLMIINESGRCKITEIR